MRKKKQNRYNSELKIKLLKAHLVGKESVSSLCEKHNVKPSVYYTWQKDLFASDQMVFDQPRKGKDQSALKLVEIEKKLQAKNEVLAELMEELYWFSVNLTISIF